MMKRIIQCLEKKTFKKKTKQLKNGVRWLVLVLLLVVLSVNLTVLAKRLMHPAQVPYLGNWAVFVMTNSSMMPDIQEGDALLVQKTPEQDIQEGDWISYLDPAENGTGVLTKEVIEVLKEQEERWFVVKERAGSMADLEPVEGTAVLGVVQKVLPQVGHVMMFMQSSGGFLCAVGLPFIAVLSLRERQVRKELEKSRQEVESVKKELERWRKGNY